jgi:hypothetical protein
VPSPEDASVGEDIRQIERAAGHAFHFFVRASVKSETGLPGQLAARRGTFNRPVGAINSRQNATETQGLPAARRNTGPSHPDCVTVTYFTGCPLLCKDIRAGGIGGCSDG